MDVVAFLQAFDEYIFRLINYEWAAPGLDEFARQLRQATNWIPLYVILLFFFGKKMPEQFIYILIFSFIGFALADSLSAQVLKPWVGRVRPCYNEQLDHVRSLIGCGGKYSTPSSHASNHFALATFWFLAVRKWQKKRWYWLWLWALIICWAQIYVGVHYPLDILLGALLGTSIGIVCYRLAVAFHYNWPLRRSQYKLRRHNHTAHT
jgi:membrane-associated phospholipid phosphatase